MSRTLVALLAAVMSLLAPAHAADAPGNTPRAAMREFLTAARAGDYEEAARYLDLRRLSAARRAAEGPALARRLEAVLDRTLWIELDTLSDEPEGELDDGLARNLEQVGVISDASGEEVPVQLVRRAGTAEQPDWRIASTTLAAVPRLSEELRLDWLDERLPSFWVETRFLELELWQWLALPLAIVLAALLAALAALVMRRVLGGLARRAGAVWIERLVSRSAGPVRLSVAALLFLLGLPFLALTLPVARALTTISGAFAVAGFSWLMLRAIDVAAEWVSARMRGQGRTGAMGLVPLGRRTAKIFLGALAAIAVLQNVGLDVTGLIAGLGVGGLAIALAAQKTVENFFGGVTLAADQPVRVGDFCRFGDRVGTVEEVGMRSTRVRTLDRTVVTVPNSEFAVLALENFTQRDRIWFHTVLGLRYETTAAQLRTVLARLRELLRADERVDPDPARVRFIGFGAHSLDLEVFAYIRTRDFDQFLAIREELLLRIMDCVAECGSAFAFPSQTVYATRDPGLPAVQEERALAAS